MAFDNGDTLDVTTNHPVRTPGGWTSVGALQNGSIVFAAEGLQRTVRSVGFYTYAPVYNLIVEGGEYVVDGVVVHSFATLRVPRTVLWTVAPSAAPHIEAAVMRVAEQLEACRDRAVHAVRRLVTRTAPRLLS